MISVGMSMYTDFTNEMFVLSRNFTIIAML